MIFVIMSEYWYQCRYHGIEAEILAIVSNSISHHIVVVEMVYFLS